MHGLREMLGVLEGVVGDDEFGSEKHVERLFESSPGFERNIFEGLLNAANQTIERALEAPYAGVLLYALASPRHARSACDTTTAGSASRS